MAFFSHLAAKIYTWAQRFGLKLLTLPDCKSLSTIMVPPQAWTHSFLTIIFTLKHYLSPIIVNVMCGRSVTVLLWNFQLHLTVLLGWNLQNIKFASGSTCLCHKLAVCLIGGLWTFYIHLLISVSFAVNLGYSSRSTALLLTVDTLHSQRLFLWHQPLQLGLIFASGAALPQRNICTTKTPICGYSCTVLFNCLDDSGLDVNLGGHRQPWASRQGVRWHTEPYLVASSVIFNI